MQSGTDTDKVAIAFSVISRLMIRGALFLKPSTTDHPAHRRA
jgi:hypothetical protein